MRKREKEEKIAMYKCILHIHIKATDSVDLNFVSFQSDLVVAYERKKNKQKKTPCTKIGAKIGGNDKKFCDGKDF